MFKNKLTIASNWKMYFKINRLISLVLLITLAGFALSGCQSANPTNEISPIPVIKQDRGWLSGEPCELPCWHGLEIDKSTEEETLTKVNGLPFILTDSETKWEASFYDPLTDITSPSTIYEYRKFSGAGLRILIGEDVVKQISFGLDFEITIGEIIDTFDTPDGIRIKLADELETCTVELYWLSKQLLLGYAITDAQSREKCSSLSEGDQINANTILTYAEITHKNWLKAMVSRGELLSWPGFLPER